MRALEFLLEDTAGYLHYGDIIVKVDTHSFDRAKEKKVSVRRVDYVLHHLPQVRDQLNQIESNQQFWVWNPETNTSLGMRRISSSKLMYQLKTLLPGKPATPNPVIVVDTGD